MQEIKTNQCEYCSKTSLNKGSIRVHERKCFYNPATQSCASCLWFSKKYVNETAYCLLGESYELSVNGFKSIFKTNCNKWITATIVEDIEIFDNEYGMLDRLLVGDMEVLKIIERIKANGSIYYNVKTGLVTD